MKTIIGSIRHAVSSKTFLIGFISMVFLIFIGSFDGILGAFQSEIPLEYGFHNKFLLNALSSDTVVIVLPILCTLPFAASYIDDVKSGFAKYIISRSSIGKYIAGKLAGCGISGGAVLTLGLIVAWVVSLLLFLPLEYPPDATSPPLYLAGTVIKKTILLFLAGAFFSICGMMFSALSENKYIAYASPFVVYYVLIILNERFFKDLVVIYPKAWLDTQNFYSAAILLAVLTGMVSLIFWQVAERRLRNV